MTAWQLLDDAPRVRARAVRDPEVSRYALRRVLFTDRDANVRAEAARALGRRDEADPAWLLDAIDDRAPLVRDAICRALARHAHAAAWPALAALAAGDRVWWVRRAAIYALGAVAADAPRDLASITAALDDPFWRVRYAAVRVLSVLGARDLEVRASLASAPSAAASYLRGSWGPTAIEAPARAASATSSLPAALLDPDPAVVTARLLAGDFDPLPLVELLCDPHAPLRTLAASRIATSNDPRAHLAAADWLEHPRVPHVAATVERLLDGLGDAAVPVATAALARADRPGAARWAIQWVVATDYAALALAALALARDNPALRAVALRLAPTPELLTWAADASLVDAVALELDVRREPASLLSLAAASPRTRALQVDAARRLSRWDLVTAALADPHFGVRALAVRALVDSARVAASAFADNPDPAIREAAHPTLDDPDPWVVRAAASRLPSLAPSDDLAAAACRAMASPDPVVRALGCTAPLHSDAQLALVVESFSDPDAAVRAAAHEALELARANLAAWLPRLQLSPTAATTARAWLERATDTVSVSVSVSVPVTATAPATAAVPVPVPATATAPIPASVTARPFARAGFSVSPLAISGAFAPSPSALSLAADSGVDLFFWEPTYDGLTRFLRRPRNRALRVIAGSYHADAASITADVHRALRWLRRDTLDVFLLFWSRSAARVDPRAYDVLATLQHQQLVRAIGFSTHDRALARAALAASPFDVVMTRHSAAHPGIETELLPHIDPARTAVLTFSALCYGRLLTGPNPPTAADCYRYSLTRPGVTATISAPRRTDELVANLAALHAPALSDADVARLRAHGAHVHAENRRFNALVREPTRDAAAAARELLASSLPPHDEIAIRPLPRAASRRRRS